MGPVQSLLLLLALVVHGGGLRVVSTPGGEDRVDDTLCLSLAVGDTAVLEVANGKAVSVRRGDLPGMISGSRVVVAPRETGRVDFQLSQGGLFGRKWVIRVDVLVARTVSVGLRHAGGLPLDDTALRALSREATRLLAPLRVAVSFADSGVLAIPSGKSSFWDLDADGRLDMRRNMDSAAPDPELDSLVRWVQSRGASFPEVVVVGLPNRTGWTLGRDLSKGDSSLFLARRANLPWRDGAGGLRTYVVSSRKGERPDTFQVRAYRDGTHRLVPRPGGMRHAHPAATDWVTLPGFDPGAFGFTPWWRLDAPILAFPGQDGRLPSRSLARIAAREIARAFGLGDHPDGSNLMCPMIRPDLAFPVVTPEQWRVLAR